MIKEEYVFKSNEFKYYYNNNNIHKNSTDRKKTQYL